MKRRIFLLGFILALLMVFSLTAYAADDGIIASGKTGAQGDNLTWVLTDDGVLTISGTGDMADYTAAGVGKAPWYDYRGSITSIVIKSGVTSIGPSAFSDCTNLKNITIPNGVASIRRIAFLGCSSLTSVTIPSSVTAIGDKAFGYVYGYNYVEEPQKGFTIYGASGSQAETYAKENGFTFIPATLAAPKITNITGGAGEVKVTWGKVSGAAQYRVFYKTSSGWKSLGDTTATSMVCPKAKANTTYTFTVRCLSADGKSYTSDYDAKGYTYTVPSGKLATPKITSITGGAGEVKVTWGKVSGAAKYRLFYLSGGKWKSLGDTTATSMVCPKAKANTTYVFTVRCLSADGKSYTSGYDKNGVTIQVK